MKVLRANQAAIEEAAQVLRNAELVAFPTETVYGLGADASNLAALNRLYEAKGRPTNHPVIVHLATVEQLDDWAINIPQAARTLAGALCPGPLTLILPKAAHVPDQVTGGQSSVGLRIPSHPVAHELLRRFGGGVAAPSANKFGRLSPTSAQDVAADFEHEVGIVLDGGPSEVGIESTIVDFSRGKPRILRPGMVLAEQIEELIGPLDSAFEPAAAQTRAPGTLKSHYAPSTATRLVEAPALKETLQQLRIKGKQVCVLSFQEDVEGCASHIVASADPRRYAHELYRNLRKLDRIGADVILVEAVPSTDAWAGVADRLKRASAEDFRCM